MLRVALYCEGAGESGGSGFGLCTGDLLGDERLGAAHVLVRRALREIDDKRSVHLELFEPLRVRGARVVGG